MRISWEARHGHSLLSPPPHLFTSVPPFPLSPPSLFICPSLPLPPLPASLSPLQGMSELSRASRAVSLSSSGYPPRWSPSLAFPSSVPGSQPRPPWATQPSKDQAVLEKCREVAECAVCEFPPNWRPNPWTNRVHVCLSTAVCVLLPGWEIPRVGDRVGDVIDPLGPWRRGKDSLGDDRASRLPRWARLPQAGWSGRGQPRDHAFIASAATWGIPPGRMEFTLWKMTAFLGATPCGSWGFSLLLRMLGASVQGSPLERACVGGAGHQYYLLLFVALGKSPAPFPTLGRVEDGAASQCGGEVSRKDTRAGELGLGLLSVLLW